MSELAVGLFVAFVGALGWLSYNHHSALRPYFKWLILIPMIVMSYIATVGLTKRYTRNVIIIALEEKKLLAPEKQTEVIQLIRDTTTAKDEGIDWSGIYFMAWFGYVYFLRYMPDILKRELS